MTNRPRPLAASPWAGAVPWQPAGPAGLEAPPCAGCPHLYTRYGDDGGPGRPHCAQGVQYGQPGCRRATPGGRPRG